MSVDSRKRVGRPKDPVKRQAILDAARDLFLAGDFERVTMDEIATQAGVSKLTVYSHFGEKDVLFAEAVRDFAENHFSPSLTLIDRDIPLDQALLMLAGSYFDSIMDDMSIRGFRMAMSYRVQQTKVPAMIWREGPERITHSVAQWLQSRPELLLDDAHDAAENFLALVRGREHYAAVFGQPTQTDRPQIEQRLRNAVHRFIRAYLV